MYLFLLFKPVLHIFIPDFRFEPREIFILVFSLFRIKYRNTGEHKNSDGSTDCMVGEFWHSRFLIARVHV